MSRFVCHAGYENICYKLWLVKSQEIADKSVLSISNEHCIRTSVGCIDDVSTILTPAACGTSLSASPSVSSLQAGCFLLGWKEKIYIKSVTFISVTSEIGHC
jgi:hypothetical protein